MTNHPSPSVLVIGSAGLDIKVLASGPLLPARRTQGVCGATWAAWRATSRHERARQRCLLGTQRTAPDHRGLVTARVHAGDLSTHHRRSRTGLVVSAHPRIVSPCGRPTSHLNSDSIHSCPTPVSQPHVETPPLVPLLTLGGSLSQTRFPRRNRVLISPSVPIML